MHAVNKIPQITDPIKQKFFIALCFINFLQLYITKGAEKFSSNCDKLYIILEK